MTGIAKMAAPGSGASRAAWSNWKAAGSPSPKARRGTLKTRQLDYGDFEIYLTEEANGGEASYGFWSGWGGQPQDGVEAPDRVRVQVPDSLPAIGGDVDVTIMPPYSGEAEIVVASENVITTRTITVEANKGAHIKLPGHQGVGRGRLCHGDGLYAA